MNAFDSTNYPHREPAELRAGDRWAWKRVDLGADYPPVSYALSYELVRHGTTGTGITITASESGAEYIIEVASATTAAYTAGTYAWTAYITRSADDERVAIGAGTFSVRADSAEDASDPRSYNRRMLDALRSTIEGRSTQAHAAYSIEGRSVTRMDPRELERWAGIYAHRVAAELNTERARAGKRPINSVQARF
jgi:hypothetical protein